MIIQAPITEISSGFDGDYDSIRVINEFDLKSADRCVEQCWHRRRVAIMVDPIFGEATRVTSEPDSLWPKIGNVIVNAALVLR